ncbi:MAG: hypothetical protein JRJ38_17640 [Deltaproteobacteria bacterium]|nr:hypothetical protein [Deltaproteobacteria bacterium]
MLRKNSVLFLCIVITFFIAFCSNADATTVTKEGLNIKFDKGTLSVDIKDIYERKRRLASILLTPKIDQIFCPAGPIR